MAGYWPSSLFAFLWSETGRVRPCPMESIRQNFTPSVNTSVYFSKSLAIGLPVSRTVVYPRRSDSVRVYWTCMKK